MNTNNAVIERVGGAADDQPWNHSTLKPPTTPTYTAVASHDHPKHQTATPSPVAPAETIATADYYFADSEFYTVRGGITAEVIYSPFVKMIQKGIVGQVIKDLRKVTLAAFEKTEDQSDVYTPDKVMLKNAIMVDYLTIFRNESTIVAYTTSTYLDKNILYLNAAMVNPRYNDRHCLGTLGHLYTWHKILEQRPEAKNDLKIIIRTRNKDVANIMFHILVDAAVSGDETATEELKNTFNKTACLIESNYDAKSGINREVYPEDLPDGSDGHGECFNNIFLKLGPCDACFIAGKMNCMRLEKIVKREVISVFAEKVMR